jgi:hypothetical protein
MIDIIKRRVSYGRQEDLAEHRASTGDNHSVYLRKVFKQANFRNNYTKEIKQPMFFKDRMPCFQLLRLETLSLL